MPPNSSPLSPDVPLDPLTPHKKQLKRAVFLDRDGTINIEKKYLIHSDDFEFISGVPEALKKLQNAGFLLVVVTNQSGVARGFFSLQQVEKLHHHMISLLEQYNVSLAGISVCPHHPTHGQGEFLCECECRKGKPGMLFLAAEDLHIDLNQSFMIGDKLADIEAGHAAGCETYLVRTGYGEQSEEQSAIYRAEVVDNLPAAVDRILAKNTCL